MKVLVACEFSGAIRDLMIDKGHDAYSCDLWRGGGKHKERHIVGDVEPLLRQEWDLVIAHPPCTYLCNSGVRWLSERRERILDMVEGCRFFLACLNANSPKVCVENPIPHKYAMERIKIPYSQVIQPWQFGHNETKATCLWLRGLPLLTSTKVMKGRRDRIHKIGGFCRMRSSKLRSITYLGIAQAITDQWG